MDAKTARDLSARLQTMVPAQQVSQLAGPMQQMSTLVIDGVSRLTDYQLEVLRSYTHFAVVQMRDALEVHDVESLREYIDRQGRAAEELGRKLAEDTQKLMSLAENSTEATAEAAPRAAGRPAPASAYTPPPDQAPATQAADAATEQARALRGAAAGKGPVVDTDKDRHTTEHAIRQATGSSAAEAAAAPQSSPAVQRTGRRRAAARFPIARYDELTFSDVVQRLDSLDRDELQAVYDYERRNKNRKRVLGAVSRRL